eukprot:CAMPEP_0115408576 /NCGR_PEP_ID=MMETSP0271-20121206/19559_1 /TAXON_ID=71861 /ORGANISM="Scrippsiella trochoidea, Strain CCMP3099" /LENGTH=180 /DNA_ID=CAMNT_0002832695 /DNA_START=109 /DNA_END=651 /DNA_ORIENTATION=+
MMSTPAARGASGRQGRTPRHVVHSDSDSTQFVESELEQQQRQQQQEQQQQSQQQQQQQQHQILSLPSMGSAAHGNGACSPCAWYWKHVGCLKGQECRYCHLCPDGELKRRRKKKVDMLRMGVNDSGSQPKMTNVQTIEYWMNIKNTFIHMEFQEVVADTHIAVVETVTTAGLTFSMQRRG